MLDWDIPRVTNMDKKNATMFWACVNEQNYLECVNAVDNLEHPERIRLRDGTEPQPQMRLFRLPDPTIPIKQNEILPKLTEPQFLETPEVVEFDFGSSDCRAICYNLVQTAIYYDEFAQRKTEVYTLTKFLKNYLPDHTCIRLLLGQAVIFQEALMIGYNSFAQDRTPELRAMLESVSNQAQLISNQRQGKFLDSEKTK